jgi:uncharacterized protein (DUF1778 family)
MPKAADDDNNRLNLRLRPEQKATPMRAATLSERGSLLVLSLLEDPPAPNARRRAAIATMPKPTRKRA